MQVQVQTAPRPIEKPEVPFPQLVGVLLSCAIAFGSQGDEIQIVGKIRTVIRIIGGLMYGTIMSIGAVMSIGSVRGIEVGIWIIVMAVLGLLARTIKEIPRFDLLALT